MDKTFYASIILLTVSIIFKVFNPKEINKFFGYRTFQSMSSKENWIYANKLSANFLIYLFSMLFTVSIMCNLQGIDYEKYYWAICGGGILILMFYIEYKLKFGEKKF
jgi:uncharacterized membrane protein